MDLIILNSSHDVLVGIVIKLSGPLAHTNHVCGPELPCVCLSLRSVGSTVGPRDLNFDTYINDHLILSLKVKVIGQRSRPQGQRSQWSKSKVVGQAHRVNVKDV